MRALLTLLICAIWASIASAAATATFLQAASDTTDLSTYTFSSQNLGTEAADRYIVICVHSRSSNAGLNISSVTVGGVTATINRQTTNTTTQESVCGIVTAHVPTGATGDVVVTLSVSASRCGIQMYRLVGIGSTVAFDSRSGLSTGDFLTNTLDTPEDGVTIAAANTFADTTTSWTGLTEDSDFALESAFTCTSAHDEFTTLQTNQTINVDFATSPSNSVYIGVSFAAAGLATSKPATTWNDANATSYDVTSVVPAPNALVLMLVVAHDDSSAPEEPSSITGTNWADGLTWTEVADSIVVDNEDDGGSARLTLYSATVPSSSSVTAGTITVNFSATHEKFGAYIVQWIDDNTTPSVLQAKTATGEGDDLTVTFDSAPDATSGVAIIGAEGENSSLGASPTGGMSDYVRASDADLPQWTAGGNYITASGGTSAWTLDTSATTDDNGAFLVEIGQAAEGGGLLLLNSKYNLRAGRQK